MNIKKKVLIIEDNEDIQELYKIYFESEGFEVKSSLDWLKGIVDVVEFKPDIIILDIMMPQMNGFEVLETLKNHSSVSSPIIVCSNLSQQSDIEKAYYNWADLYLRKSDYQWEQIVTVIKEFMVEKGI